MNIALIAHDGKKTDLVSFFLQNTCLFNGSELYTTHTTGVYLENAGFKVTKLLTGPKGGDARIAAMVATGNLGAVIFFRNPLGKHPHEPDVQMRMCDVHNVPLATNPASAILIMRAINE